MSYSLPSPWRLFDVLRRRLNQWSVGERPSPLCDDVKRWTRPRAELIVAVDGQRSENVTEFVDQLKKGAFLNVRHGVARFAVFDPSDVTNADGVVVALGGAPRHGSTTFDGAHAVVQDDEMVSDVRPIAAVRCANRGWCRLLRVGTVRSRNNGR